MKKIIKKVPLPISGLALAFASLGIFLSQWFPAIQMLFGITSVSILILILLKAFMHKEDFINDKNNPLIAAVIPLIFITIGVLSVYIVDMYPIIAKSIWLLSVVMMLIFIVWFLSKFVFSNFMIKSVFTSWYIPFVGLCVMAWVSPFFAFEKLGYYLFSLGFSMNILVSIPIIYRYLRIDIPEPAQPMFAIFPAPFSATIAAYFAVSNGDINVFIVSSLVLISQFLFFLTLVKLPSYLSRPFYPSWVGFTFPFVITSTMLMQVVIRFREIGYEVPQFLDYLFYAEIIFAMMMVLFVGFKYVIFLSNTNPKKIS
jgi:exfoliative toxin A/B